MVKILNNVGQQCHQYRQDKQSPLTWRHWAQNRLQQIMKENQALAWDTHKKEEGWSRLMVSQPSRSDNWISNHTTDTVKPVLRCHLLSNHTTDTVKPVLRSHL